MIRSIPTRIAVSAVLLSSLAIGAVGCAGGPSTRDGYTAAPVSVMEDDPSWDCLTDGNKVCGAVMADDSLTERAWAVWDAQQGYRQIRVDPSREFRIDFTGYSTEGIHQGPGELVLTQGGMYYRYAVSY